MPSFPILDQFNFHHTLEATPGLAIAFFTREGCGSCRHWRRVLADYHARHPHGAHIFEIDAERDAALTREFGVFHLPALFLFHNGHFHAALKVQAHPDKLQQAIDAALLPRRRKPPDRTGGAIGFRLPVQPSRIGYTQNAA